jgi:hypothetical protein
MSVCIGFYLVVDLLLVGRAWFLEDESQLTAAALILSQCSLAALWAASSRAIPYVRFAVPPIAAVACWYVLSRILPWGFGEPASAAWAVALGVQTLAIVIAINLYEIVCNLDTRRSGDANRPNQSPLTFSLLTLLLWTAVIAVGFGFIQFGRVRWGWTADVADWEHVQLMPFIGAYNALLAVLWLWAFTAPSWKGRSAKIVGVVLLIGILGWSLSYVIRWETGFTEVDLRGIFVLTVAQSFFLASSLAFVQVADSKRRQSVAAE